MGSQILYNRYFLCRFTNLSLPYALFIAVPISPDAFGTVRSEYGYELSASLGTAAGEMFIVDLGPAPIALGAFDASGNIVGGDAVLMAYLALGDAPVQLARLGATTSLGPSDGSFTNEVRVTPSRMLDFGTANTDGFVLPAGSPSVALSLAFTTLEAPSRTEGELWMGLAFLTKADQPLADALGIAIPFTVRIGDSRGFINRPKSHPGIPFTPKTFTMPLEFGGASRFARSVPEPNTLAPLVVGIAGIIGLAKIRKLNA